jgi:hypothetical protein
VGAVTPISVEIDMAMVAPKVVGTLASIAWVNVYVICACEEDYNDIEAPALTDLVILFKALPLRKCMHKDADFP